MPKTDTVFAGSIPALYEKYLGPLIFQPYAEDVAQRLSGLESGALLETAAGTGIVTRTLTRVLPAGVRIVATDLNPPMLAYAAGTIPSGRVTWQQVDAQALPFPDATFDAVVCQFGAMFFPDKLKAYAEARRVLKRDGRFIFNVWDKIEFNEFADVVTATAGRIFPGDPPRFLARTPHGYHDKDAIATTLADAGFGNVNVETVTRRSVAPSCQHVAIGYCQGTPLRNEIEARDASRLAEVTERAADDIGKRFGRGAVDGMIQAHVIVAR
jgi:ubiquinone/menaquinone biosynthesis C-methylase UbiE